MRQCLEAPVILLCCAMLVMPQAQSLYSTDTIITRTYDYTLDGRQGEVSLALSTGVYNDYLMEEPTWGNTDNESYFLAFINEPAQKPYIKTLADGIRKKTDDPDDQARIATNLVQHMVFESGSKYRFPYEVLYTGGGVCGEKSFLLASLLKELGFGSSILYFVPENHMTVGISCQVPYAFRHTGYCMIETTPRVIITDETTFHDAGITTWSSPEVFVVSEGLSLKSAGKDYSDARLMISLKSGLEDARRNGRNLSFNDYGDLYRLKNKYDIF
jgi:hypothetical protein